MSFRFLARPSWIIWTMVVLVAAPVMVNLSLWQWDRLHERRDENERIEARMSLPVEPVSALVAGAAGGALEEVELRVASARGTYRPDEQVLVANRTHEGMAGWWVVTPLVLDDGSAVAVNRGWVPRDVTPEGSWAAFAPPTGTVEVTGLLQASQGRSAGPLDDPRTLPRLNVEVLDERVAADLLPLWLQLQTQDPAQTSGLPAVLAPPEMGDGPHLNYAGQWLIFATLTVVVYGALVLRTARRGERTGAAPLEGAARGEPVVAGTDRRG
jgi:cytochrome oxidase assembly protein ShyY1